MALDLSNLASKSKPQQNDEGLGGIASWAKGALADAHKGSMAGVMQGTAEGMKEGKNPLDALWKANQDSQASRVRTGGRVLTGLVMAETAGKVDISEHVEKAGKHFGAEDDGVEFKVAPKAVRNIAGAAAGHPGGLKEGAMEGLKAEGHNWVQKKTGGNPVESMFGGKKGGGVVADNDVKGFQAMFQTRKELGNSGLANNGPKIEMPGFKMPALPRK